MSGGRVVVLGSCMMDLTVHASRRPERGETLIGQLFVQSLGGKGFNQAVAASRAGATVAMLGAVGDDEYGRRFLDALDAEGIDRTGMLGTPAGTGIGLPLVEDGGHNSIVVVPRANDRLTVDDVERQAALIADADVLCLQLELPLDTAVAAARIARDAGRAVLVNPAPARTGCEELLGLATVIVPNEVEAAMLSGATGAGVEEAADLLAAAHPAALVVVTAGEAGALVAGSSPRRFPAPPVPVVDTVGAGDVFCGYLAARLAHGVAVDESVAEAVAAASLSVQRHGGAPSVPRRDEVRPEAVT